MSSFMWMYEVRTADGERLQVYKHIETRRSMHLDPRGRAYAYVDDGYMPVSLAAVLEAVLRPWWEELGASPEEAASAWAAIGRARAAGARAGLTD